MRKCIFVLFVWCFTFQTTADGQNLAANSTTSNRTSLTTPPGTLEILWISVSGVDNEYPQALLEQNNGFKVGDHITNPGDPAFADAIPSI